MLRRIIGITGISLWAGLILAVVALKVKADVEEIFQDLPEGWRIEKSVVVPKDQTLAFSRKLGARISKLTNTYLSIDGKPLQVNVVQCSTERGAERAFEAIVKEHDGHTISAARYNKTVVEFAKCDDLELIKQARLGLGFAPYQLDSIAAKLIKNIPDGWQVEKSFIVPRDQTAAVEEKLGGRIRNLSNTIFSIQEKRFQVNVIECATPRIAREIYKSIRRMKDNPAFCLRFRNMVVEFVGDDVELARRAPGELGFRPKPKGTKLPIEDMAGDFIKLLAEGEFSKATENFDAAMKKAASPEKLRQIWSSLVNQHGPFEKQLDTQTKSISIYEAVVVTCEFEKMDVDLQVTFNAAKQIAGFHIANARPKADRQQSGDISHDSFSEKEIQVGTGQWPLPGTLTLPKGEGNLPAVVLVHGSGPHDRDETIGPNKPFRDLAHGLASKGIAVLRYEKRTKAHPLQMAFIASKITVKEETIDDALAAVALLRKTSQIDANRIFILGHSLGGFVIPRIGKLDSKITGFIVMAGSARPPEDLILEQAAYFSSLDGVITDDEKANLEKLKTQVAKVKDPNLSLSTPATDSPLGIPAAYWLDLRGYQPAEMAKELSQPMLIIQGGRDYQVTDTDFQLWKKALSSKTNVEFKFYEKLNHLFMQGQGKSTPAEYQVPGHVAQTVIEDIADWIKKH